MRLVRLRTVHFALLLLTAGSPIAGLGADTGSPVPRTGAVATRTSEAALARLAADRDAVVAALRRLGEKPTLVRRLARDGDLASLLSEAGMTRSLDDLIDRARQGDGALRASGSRSISTLTRLIERLSVADATPGMHRLAGALEAFVRKYREVSGQDDETGLYDWIQQGFDPGIIDKTEEIHAADFDTGAKSTGRDFPTVSAAAGGPRYRFSLIRVAPYSGVNAFEFRNLRSAIEAARTGTTGGTTTGGCNPGPLTLVTNLPVVSFAGVYFDATAAVMTLAVRGAGSAGADTPLVATLPALDTTRFTAGPGWLAISPALPRDYAAGAPSQTFVLRRLDSGDSYRFTVGFLGTSQIVVTSASGECCGPGGCP